MDAALEVPHDPRMDWQSQHLQHPEWWNVDDIRWLGTPDRNDWDSLFGDRSWLLADERDGDWPPPYGGQGTWPGIVTADLVYDAAALPSPEDRSPPPPHLAVAVHLPDQISTGRPTNPVVVPAGTEVQIAGHCRYRNSLTEDNFMYTWALPGGPWLGSYSTDRGRPSLLIFEIVPALVVPSWSPLATVEAGSELVQRAFDLASDALHHRFRSFSRIARAKAAVRA